MKIVLSLVLISTLAFAQAADAPLNPHPAGRSLHLEAGELAPMTGQLLEDTEHARREWANERTAGTLEALKRGNTILPTPAFIAIVAGTAVLGIVAGGAIIYAVTPKGPPR